MVKQLWIPHANKTDLILNTYTDSDYEKYKNMPGAMDVNRGVNPYTGEAMDPNADVIPIQTLKSQQAYVAPVVVQPTPDPYIKIQQQQQNTADTYYGPKKYYYTIGGTFTGTEGGRRFGSDQDLSNASEQQIIDAYNKSIDEDELLSKQEADAEYQRQVVAWDARNAEIAQREKEAREASEKQYQTILAQQNAAKAALAKSDNDSFLLNLKQEEQASTELGQTISENDFNKWATKWDTDKNLPGIQLPTNIYQQAKTRASQVGYNYSGFFDSGEYKYNKDISSVKDPEYYVQDGKLRSTGAAPDIQTFITNVSDSTVTGYYQPFSIDPSKKSDLTSNEKISYIDTSQFESKKTAADEAETYLKSLETQKNTILANTDLSSMDTYVENYNNDLDKINTLNETTINDYNKSIIALDTYKTAVDNKEYLSGNIPINVIVDKTLTVEPEKAKPKDADYSAADTAATLLNLNTLLTLPEAVDNTQSALNEKVDNPFISSTDTFGSVSKNVAKGVLNVLSIPSSTIDFTIESIYGKGSDADKAYDKWAKDTADSITSPVKPYVSGFLNSIDPVFSNATVKKTAPFVADTLNVASIMGTGATEFAASFVGGSTKRQVSTYVEYNPFLKDEDKKAIVRSAEQTGRIVGGVAPSFIPGVGGILYSTGAVLSGTQEQAASSLLTAGAVGLVGRGFKIGSEFAATKTGKIPIAGNLASGIAYTAPKIDQFYDAAQLASMGSQSIGAAYAGDMQTAKDIEKQLVIGIGGSKLGVGAGEALFDATFGTGLYSNVATATKTDVPGRESYSAVKQILENSTVNVQTVTKPYKSIDTLTTRNPADIGDVSSGYAGVFGTIKESGSEAGYVGKYFVDKSGPTNIKIGKVEIPFTKVVDSFINPSRPVIYDIPTVKTGSEVIPGTLKETILFQLETKGKVDADIQKQYLNIAQDYANITGSKVATISPKVLQGLNQKLELETFMLFPKDAQKMGINKPQLIGFERYTQTPIIRETGYTPGAKVSSVVGKNVLDNFNRENIILNLEAKTANRKLAQMQGFEKQSAISYDVQQHGKIHTENVYKNLIDIKGSETKLGNDLSRISNAGLKWAAYLHDSTKVGAAEVSWLGHGETAAKLVETGRINVPLEVNGKKVMFEQLPKWEQKYIIDAVKTHTTIKPISATFKGGTTIKGLTEGLTGSALAKALANADRLEMSRFGSVDMSQLFNMGKIKTNTDIGKKINIDMKTSEYKPINIDYKPIGKGYTTSKVGYDIGYKTNIDYKMPDYISSGKKVPGYDYVKPYKGTDYIKPYTPIKDYIPTYKSQTDYIPIYKPKDYVPDYKPIVPDYIKPYDYIPDYTPVPDYKPPYEIDDYKPVDYIPTYKIDDYKDYNVARPYGKYPEKNRNKLDIGRPSGVGRAKPDQYAKSYNVYVRKGSGATGKKRKVSEVLVEKNLPYSAALNVGLNAAAKYSQRTTILKPSKSPPKYQDFGMMARNPLLDQFRPLSMKSKIPQSKQTRTFVEKSRYAINTQEEKKGIPFKAAQMRREGLIQTPKRGKKSGFWGMRV